VLRIQSNLVLFGSHARAADITECVCGSRDSLGHRLWKCSRSPAPAGLAAQIATSLANGPPGAEVAEHTLGIKWRQLAPLDLRAGDVAVTIRLSRVEVPEHESFSLGQPIFTDGFANYTPPS
jgi:hypothetical protein